MNKELDLLQHLAIQEILHKEKKDGSWFYRVKWSDSWLPEDLLQSCFSEFLQSCNGNNFTEMEIGGNKSSAEDSVDNSTDSQSEQLETSQASSFEESDNTENENVDKDCRYILVTENEQSVKQDLYPPIHAPSSLSDEEVSQLQSSNSNLVDSSRKFDENTENCFYKNLPSRNGESSSKLPTSANISEYRDGYEASETMLYLCNLCSRSFSTHEEFSLHADYCERLLSNQNESNNEPPLNAKCYKLVPHVSEESFANTSTYDLILKEVPTSNIARQEPNMEKPNFGRSYRRKSPIELSKTLIHECLNCKMTFANLEYLNRHLTRCKSHADLNFKCETCGRGFTTKGSLELHVSAVHLKKKDFGCSICGKLFSKKHILKIHLDTHFDKRNFECRTCGKTFVQKSNLTRHERIHKETNYGYICKYCGQVYSQNKYLQNHLRSHFRNDDIMKSEDIIKNEEIMITTTST